MEVDLTTSRSIDDEIGCGRTEGYEAAVRAHRGSVAVGVACGAIGCSGKESSVRLAICGRAGTSVAQENLRVTVLIGGVGNKATVGAESGSLFRDSESGV